MDQHTGKRVAAALTLAGMGALAGCAGTGAPGTGGRESETDLQRLRTGGGEPQLRMATVTVRIGRGQLALAMGVTTCQTV